MQTTATEISTALRSISDSSIAEHSQRFFKTGKGQYAEGDKFLGIRVPKIRQQVKKFKSVAISEILILLKSSFHEERLFALIALIEKYSKGDDTIKNQIYELYLGHIEYINNWDLVDSSASQIAGLHLYDKDRQPLYILVKSDNLWARRIAIIATFYFIKQNDFTDTTRISAILLNDQHDLIHKAVGWMLREVGKRNLAVEEQFLQKHYKNMPRTMLRYAIEKFDEETRQAYLKGVI
ncbi:DNA alkylation repair protein [Desulfococcaceae bacterium HSG7]|nr:DNA alkylation repair protein [Desulfococcaceae bacterium HSG7]